MCSLMEGQNNYKNREQEPKGMTHRTNKINKGLK